MEKKILVFEDVSYTKEELLQVLPTISEQLEKKAVDKRLAILSADVHQMAMMLLGVLYTDLTVYLLHPNVSPKKIDELKEKGVPIINSVSIEKSDRKAGDPDATWQGSSFVFSTSNTTSSKSHWVKIPARVLIYKAEKITEMLDIRESDVTCLISPLSFIQSVWTLLSHLFMNATVIAKKFSISNLNEIFEKNEITTFVTVPSIVRTMIEKVDNIGGLRLLGVGGDFADELLISCLAAKWPELYLSNIYGCTETSAADIILKPRLLKSNDRELFSLGTASGFSEVEICNMETGRPVGDGEEGVIHIKGEFVATSYYGDESKSIVEEYGFKTGDIAYRDENGYYYFKGRSGGLIKCNGNKMSCIEIEQAVRSVSGVTEASVFGIPDKLYGQIPICFITTSKDIGLEELRENLGLLLEKYKFPKKFYLCDSIPTTVSGKKSRNLEQYHIEEYIEMK